MFFENEPLKLGKKRQVQNLTFMRYPKKERRVLTYFEAIMLPAGSDVVCDTETFSNYCLIAFKHIATQSYFFVQKTPVEDFDRTALAWYLFRFRIITFNGNSYDLAIINAALKGDSLERIKAVSDGIIIGGERPEWNAKSKYNHIDLIEVAPLQASLKTYAGRLHCQRMQEMPVDPHKPLTPEQSNDVAEYCFNDLDNTELLFGELGEAIRLREKISIEIGEDVRSRSDAQIAERVISVEYKKLTGSYPRKSKEIDTSARTYTPPSYMRFETPLLQQTLAKVVNAKFEIGAGGYAEIPKEIHGLNLPMGNQVYRMSIGGLHSSETCTSLRSTDEIAISDFDVASYYPKIILNGNVYPPLLGKPFLLIYNGIVVKRLNAKAAKRTIESAGLKITINGTFGKLGNPYSIMYSPELMLYVTLTGQLSLLMLIEPATTAGFEVVNANTDGVVFRYPREREAELKAIVKMWEQTTSLELEKTSYVGYFSRDVNNYMTLKVSGEWKTKGAYCERGSAADSVLSRNPETFICADAVKAFIADKTPIAKTIRESRDIRRFVSVRNVKGGAHKNGLYLGKVIRWYYAEGEHGSINSVLTGNKVPKTDGAKPLMELGEFPADMNFPWYEREALSILHDIGYFGKQATLI